MLGGKGVLSNLAGHGSRASVFDGAEVETATRGLLPEALHQVVLEECAVLLGRHVDLLIERSVQLMELIGGRRGPELCREQGLETEDGLVAVVIGDPDAAVVRLIRQDVQLRAAVTGVTQTCHEDG